MIRLLKVLSLILVLTSANAERQHAKGPQTPKVQDGHRQSAIEPANPAIAEKDLYTCWAFDEAGVLDSEGLILTKEIQPHEGSVVPGVWMKLQVEDNFLTVETSTTPGGKKTGIYKVGAGSPLVMYLPNASGKLQAIACLPSKGASDCRTAQNTTLDAMKAKIKAAAKSESR